MTKTKFTLAILASGCLWGFMGFFRRYMGDIGVETNGIIFLRCGIAALLFAVTIAIKDPRLFKIRLRDLWCFLGTGLMSLLFFSICYFNAMTLMSLSAAAILLYTAPSFVILISLVLFKEKLTRRKIIALAMAFAGCCLVCGILSSDTRLTAAGVLYGLGSGFGYALYSIFGKLAMVRGYKSPTINLYTTLFAALGAALFCDAGECLRIMTASWDNAALCIAAGVVTCYLPYMLYTYGLSGHEAGTASIMASVEPVVATAVGIIIFKEPMTPEGLAGVILILAAVVLLNLKSKAPASASEKQN